MNTHQLSKYLTVNIEEDTIIDIIGRMEVLLDHFNTHDDLKQYAAFLHVYQQVTKGVLVKSYNVDGYYKDYAAIEKLDILFAKYYFGPLRHYLIDDTPMHPWKKYFEYSEQNKTSAFVRLLLGINAHINADLCRTLTDLKYTEQDDFNKVNDILEGLIPQTMAYLAHHEHDYFGMGAAIVPELVKEEFKKVVVGWRNDAWNNSRVLIATGAGDKEFAELYMKVEGLADRIIELFGSIKSYTNPTHFLDKLHDIRVIL